MEKKNIEMREAFFGKVDRRRRQELSDSRMVQEDEYAIANLSPRFIHKTFNPDRFEPDSLGAKYWDLSAVEPDPDRN